MVDEEEIKRKLSRTSINAPGSSLPPTYLSNPALPPLAFFLSMSFDHVKASGPY